MTHPATTIRSRAFALAPAWRFIAVFFAIGFLLETSPGRLPAEEAAPKTVTPSSTATHEAPKPSGRIQYVGPDTYILLDSEGRPQPVPGMTYEDFLAAWKKLNQAATPESQPRFTIESLKIDGESHGQQAELKIQAAVHLLADGPVDVPFGLVGAILQGEPHFDKAKLDSQNPKADHQTPTKTTRSEYLDFDPQHGGFVARMTGTVGERRSLSFNVIVPLSRDGAETTLPLNCPRCLSSSLSMIVDSAITEARANNGAVIAKKLESDRGTRIDVAGPTGQFRLTWQPTNTDATAIASVLNAVGAIHVAIDGRGVRSDAHLTVRSLGGTFDQFRVRLPRGAKLIPNTAAGGNQDQKYRITEEPPANSPPKAANDASQIVLVELKEKQQGPVVVDLSTEQSSHDASQSLELAGFEVLGAVRQFGDIALNVANDWQARWNIGRDVRQVDPAEIGAALQRTDLSAAFQYDAQPWSLGVRITPRQSRVHVTPQYELELLPEEARLTVRLAYQIFGARAFEFRVETDGWEMSGEPVESGGLVEQDRVNPTPDGTLILPVAQGVARKAEISFSLRRALTRDTSRLQLPLPVPLADSVGSGDLTVRAPADAELLPDLANSTGLAASPAREANGAANADASTELHFRTLVPSAAFVADRKNRSREETTQLEAQIAIGPNSVQVNQRIAYVVRYEPIKELIFDAPSNAPIDGDDIKLELVSIPGGKSEPGEQRMPLRFEPVPDDTETQSSESRRVRLVLPQARVGRFAVDVRYRIPRPTSSSTASVLPIPLMAAADSQATSAVAIVRTPPGVSVSLGSGAEGSSWKSIAPQRKSNDRNAGAEFTSERAELVLPLIVGAVDVNLPSTTVVERVWLQTWIAGEIEQDRAAFRLRTSNAQTTLELPPDATPGDVEILVDGHMAEVSSRATGRVVVRLARDSQNFADGAGLEPATYTLELRYRRTIQHALITRHSITPPQIDGTTELSQVYWQVVLPGDENIVQSPAQLVSASQWQWLGSFWGRRPIMSQTELEKWVAASPQVSPSAADNQYLFSGLLPLSTIALVTAPRWAIVLVASSAAIIVLAGWYYLPIARRAWLLVALIFVIAVAAIAYPTAALLIAQAAAVGVLLASLSMLISRLATRPGRRSFAAPISPSSQRTITPRIDSIVMPSVIAAASTAPTVALRTSDSEQ